METFTTKTKTSNILAQRFKGSKLEKKRIPRPLNAFFIFANKNRAKLKKKFPEKSNREISIELGQIWQKLTVVDRTPYHVESQKAVMQHKLKYPDYSYIPGSPKLKQKTVMKSMQLFNFTKNITAANSTKEPYSIFERKPLSTNAISPHWVKKSETTAKVQDSNKKCVPQCDSSMKKHISQSSSESFRNKSTIPFPKSHQFINGNQLTAPPNMPWMPWNPTWSYVPVAAPPTYRTFPTSTFNTLHPSIYNEPFFHGPGYLWPPSTPLSGFYSRDSQINENSAMSFVTNDQFLSEKVCTYQTENVYLENGKYSLNSESLNTYQLQQDTFLRNNSTNDFKSQNLITTHMDCNYQIEDKNEEDIDIISL